MKRIATVAAGVLIAGVMMAGEEHPDHAKQAENVKITPQTTCPVMGGKINKDLYVDHDGKRVYFCCPMCPKKFKADPAKYIKKLEADGVTVAKVQTTCPVMGGKIDKKHYADVKGRRIYVCCPGCIGKIKADPDTYIKKLESDGAALDPSGKSTEKKMEMHGGDGGHEMHHH